MELSIDKLNDATQYATIYVHVDDELVPVGTAQRRRAYETGPAWRVYSTDGQMVGRVWATRDYSWLAQRLIAIMRADITR